MRSRTVHPATGASLMGLAVGVAVGLAAGLLAAPTRGSVTRARLRDRAADTSLRLQALASSTRDRAKHAFDRGMSLIEESRSALRTTHPQPLRATVGEIASMHDGSELPTYGVTS